VLSILVFSGVVLLPVLLPVAGTDRALDLHAAAGFQSKSNDKSNPAPEFPQMERLALGNVQVSNQLIICLCCYIQFQNKSI
jgi:hypothetical protein